MKEILKNVTPNILVIGDVMVDNYLWGDCDRISPEAPVQVVNVDYETKSLGGAGNVVNNLTTLGAKVKLASVVGNDETADVLNNLLKEKKIDNSLILRSDQRMTTIKTRIIASHQQIVRFDKEMIKAISKDEEYFLLNKIQDHIKSVDFVVISDYAKGVLTEKLTKKIIEICHTSEVNVLVDPKGNNYKKYKGAFAITPNKKEASSITGIELSDNESIKKACLKLKKELSLDYSIITLSKDGIALFGDELRIIDTKVKEVYDVTGAGDTVISGIAYGISCGLEVYEAVEFANYAAAVVVSKLGSATVTLDEISKFIENSHAYK